MISVFISLPAKIIHHGREFVINFVYTRGESVKKRDRNNSNQKLPHVLCDYPDQRHCQDLGSRSSDVILQKPVVVSRNVGHFLKLEETILQHSTSVFAYYFLYSIFIFDTL